MKLLLGSGGFRTEARRARFAHEMREFFGPVPRILFVPYALADHDAYVRAIEAAGLHGGYELDGIHRHADPRRAVRDARGIFVGGGNTFRLLRELEDRELLGVIRDRVHAGLPYLGVSAGTNVACPTIQTTNDMPITAPDSFDALALVPFQVNPHYFEGSVWSRVDDEFVEHFGETRDDRIREYHEMNDHPVVGLYEGGFLRVLDSELTLVGTGARVFRRGREPVDYATGAAISGLMPA